MVAGVLIWFVSSVTLPFSAKTRPSTLTPVTRVSLVYAMIVPAKEMPVPSVAELPTWKKTLAASAPLMRLNEAVPVVRVLPI
jgi:hypothetical protein